MKKYTNKWYKAMHLRGSGELERTSESIAGIKEIIDRSNERAESLGYKKESWLIVSVKTSAEYGDDGIFLSSKRTEVAEQVYPVRLD